MNAIIFALLVASNQVPWAGSLDLSIKDPVPVKKVQTVPVKITQAKPAPLLPQKPKAPVKHVFYRPAVRHYNSFFATHHLAYHYVHGLLHWHYVR